VCTHHSLLLKNDYPSAVFYLWQGEFAREVVFWEEKERARKERRRGGRRGGRRPLLFEVLLCC
jgi:hypothetical protein